MQELDFENTKKHPIELINIDKAKSVNTFFILNISPAAQIAHLSSKSKSNDLSK